jgi:hypothetical protein
MEDENKEVFSKNFKKAMVELGLSNKDASKTMDDVALQTITAYRSGKIMPPVRYIIKFSVSYEVNLNWLLRDIGEMFLPTEEGFKKEADQMEEIFQLVKDIRADNNQIIERVEALEKEGKL